MNPQIISEEPISMAELRKRFESTKEGEELSFRAQKTKDYLSQNTILNTKHKVAEIKKKITDLEIPRLKDMHIIKIIDMMPVNVDELKGILSGYTVTVTQDNLKKILDVINEYR